jgi:peptide/nickel transport system permease protein
VWRRLAASVAIVFTVVTLTFFVIRIAPGDPFISHDDRIMDPARRAWLIKYYGLDKPLHVQYGRYLRSIVQGQFGDSFYHKQPVSTLLRRALPYTFLLAAAALAIDFLLGMTLGVFQAMRARSTTDVTLSAGTLFLASVPTFWLGMVLIIVFSDLLGWFPPGDPESVIRAPTLFGRTLDHLYHLILPAMTLGVVGAATTARYQRAAALDASAHDYVQTARGKGLTNRDIMRRHVLRNAMLPMVTLFGLAFPFLLTGTVLIETLFSWPGMGQLSAKAILQRDYPVVSATMLVASMMVVLGSLIADVLASLVDPRVRLQENS